MTTDAIQSRIAMLVVHKDRLRPFLLRHSVDERQDDQSHDEAINKIMKNMALYSFYHLATALD